MQIFNITMDFFKNLFKWTLFILGMSPLNAQLPSPAQPILDAHAHNDYAKTSRKPLFKAISMGCVSVEIDVFPVKNGQLKVAHIPLFLGLRPNIETRYLRPLSEYLKINEGRIYTQDSVRLVLMIDVKRNAVAAYRMLRALVIKYEDVFTVWYPTKDSVKYGAAELLISGSKPWKQLKSDSVWYMRLDGGLGQIGDTAYTASMVPRVSARYGSQFKWRGKGEMPAAEQLKLQTLVRQAHDDGRQIRFWAMPNNPKVWQAMRNAGVDWLNVDKIKRLHRWNRTVVSIKRE